MILEVEGMGTLHVGVVCMYVSLLLLLLGVPMASWDERGWAVGEPCDFGSRRDGYFACWCGMYVCAVAAAAVAIEDACHTVAIEDACHTAIEDACHAVAIEDACHTACLE